MALLKCPECEHLVSEHAGFCPQCGCKIEYILDFYKKLEKKAKAKKNAGPIYESLSEEAKHLLQSLKQVLEQTKTPFFFDSRTDFVGFRKAKGEKLLIYFSRHADGTLVIHIFNSEKQTNETFPFNPADVDRYLTIAKRDLFEVEEPLSVSKSPELDYFALSTKEELQAVCRYTVSEGRVLPIQVTDVVAKEGKYRVWFALPNGTKRFCSLTNVENILFDTEKNARARLLQGTAHSKIEVDSKPTVTPARKPDEEYVLCSNGQYIIGFHETRHYENVMSGYTFHKKSSSFITVRVPDFSGDLSKAVVIYSKEDAERTAQELSQQTGYLIEARLRSNCSK